MIREFRRIMAKISGCHLLLSYDDIPPSMRRETQSFDLPYWIGELDAWIEAKLSAK